MERRTFMAMLTGGIVVAPLAAESQQAAKIARIGYLEANLAANPYMHEAFRQGLRNLGYVEGRNVVIEYRDAEGKFERYPALAAELVALKKPGRPLVPARRTGQANHRRKYVHLVTARTLMIVRRISGLAASAS